MLISLKLIARSKFLLALCEQARREIRPYVLKQVLTVGRVDQVGAGAFRRIEQAGVEEALGHAVLTLHKPVEVDVAPINVSQEDSSTGWADLYAPLLDLLARCTVVSWWQLCRSYPDGL